jgi:hypothetical protein
MWAAIGGPVKLETVIWKQSSSWPGLIVICAVPEPDESTTGGATWFEARRVADSARPP